MSEATDQVSDAELAAIVARAHPTKCTCVGSCWESTCAACDVCRPDRADVLVADVSRLVAELQALRAAAREVVIWHEGWQAWNYKIRPVELLGALLPERSA
jgi:hypothetical protein